MAQAKRRKAESKPLFKKKNNSASEKMLKKASSQGGFGSLFIKAFKGGFATLIVGAVIGSMLTVLLSGYLKDPLSGIGSGLHALIERTKRDAQPNVNLTENTPTPEQDIEVKYDYYTILPEVERLIPEAPNQTAQTNTAAPATTIVEPLPEANEQVNNNDVGQTEELTVDSSSYFILQAASYANEADAEQLKAKLALSGQQAYIQRVTINGGNFYRVRMGPFNDLAILKATEAELISLDLTPLALEVDRSQ